MIFDVSTIISVGYREGVTSMPMVETSCLGYVYV